MSTRRGPALSSRLVAVMAVAAGISVANLYYAQPLLGAMARALGLPPAALGVVTAVTQLGYALGLLLVTPLGDAVERRPLIVVLLVAVAVPLVVVAAAPDLPVLAAASLVVGLGTVTPQVVVPLAATLAPERARGRIVGTVMSGLLIGILGARTFSGAIAGWLGWRAVFLLAAALSLVLAAVLHRALPREKPAERLRYGALLRSLITLWRGTPVLRESALIGAALFGAFSVFWTTLTFHLAGAPWHLGPARIGLFGIAGLAGAMSAPLAGRVADRRGPRALVGAGLLVAFAAYVLLTATRTWLWGAALGAAVLDLGVQGGHIANQTRIYALLPAARSRVNTVYMFVFFLGGSLGSALGAAAWHVAAWTGAMGAGALILIAGLGVYALGGFRLRAEPGRREERSA